MSNERSEANDFEALVSTLPPPRREDSLDLALLWRELIQGRARVGATLNSSERCYASVVTVTGAGSTECAARSTSRSPTGESPTGGALPPRAVRLLERVLLGEAAKVVAIDSGISISMLASTVHACFRKMGVECSLRDVPVLLVMAAHAASGRPGVPRAVVHCVERERERERERAQRRIISIVRPDLHLKGLLSESEYAVARLRNEGKTGAQIAEIRATSVRTVANQLSSAYRKLNISGRIELVCYSLRIARATGPGFLG